VEGWRPEAGVRGEGRRRARGEVDYAAAAVEGDVGGSEDGADGCAHPKLGARQGESREEKIVGEVVPRRIDIRTFCNGITAIPLLPMYEWTYGLVAAGSGAGDVRLLASSGVTYGLAAAGSGAGDIQLLVQRVTHGEERMRRSRCRSGDGGTQASERGVARPNDGTEDGSRTGVGARCP
jgi:hypothetical protein